MPKHRGDVQLFERLVVLFSTERFISIRFKKIISFLQLTSGKSSDAEFSAPSSLGFSKERLQEIIFFCKAVSDIKDPNHYRDC